MINSQFRELAHHERKAGGFVDVIMGDEASAAVHVRRGDGVEFWRVGTQAYVLLDSVPEGIPVIDFIQTKALAWKVA